MPTYDTSAVRDLFPFIIFVTVQTYYTRNVLVSLIKEHLFRRREHRLVELFTPDYAAHLDRRTEWLRDNRSLEQTPIH